MTIRILSDALQFIDRHRARYDAAVAGSTPDVDDLLMGIPFQSCSISADVSAWRHRVIGKLSGDPCFRRTRIPLDMLRGNLASCLSLSEILQHHQTRKHDAVAAIQQACRLPGTAAPWIAEKGQR
jgi:uncharacterized protein (DUF433 family)